MRAVERSQGLAIAALEEIAYYNGWISAEQLGLAAERYGKSPYGEHLRKVREGKIVFDRRGD